MITRTPTTDVAKYWAKTGTDILFEGNIFDETVSKEKLEYNLYNQIA